MSALAGGGWILTSASALHLLQCRKIQPMKPPHSTLVKNEGGLGVKNNLMDALKEFLETPRGSPALTLRMGGLSHLWLGVLLPGAEFLQWIHCLGVGAPIPSPGSPFRFLQNFLLLQ